MNIDRLKELLIYDPDTGIFTRRVSVSNRQAGEVAGYISNGYVIIAIDGRNHYAHRLAWAYMTGEWPTIDIDHWDRDKSNNRFKNLRHAGSSMNHGNSVMPITNTSGVKGVCPSGSLTKPWKAQIQRRYLGSFATVEEAKACYDEAARELYKEFYRP